MAPGIFYDIQNECQFKMKSECRKTPTRKEFPKNLRDIHMKLRKRSAIKIATSHYLHFYFRKPL